eukprot:1155447-Pelagomonas_calceolata.AAC.2
MHEKFEFFELFDRTFGQGKGGQERGQQSPYMRAPAFPPLGLSILSIFSCILQRGVKVRRTALVKCDKVRVKFEFDKVRGYSGVGTFSKSAPLTTSTGLFLASMHFASKVCFVAGGDATAKFASSPS